MKSMPFWAANSSKSAGVVQDDLSLKDSRHVSSAPINNDQITDGASSTVHHSTSDRTIQQSSSLQESNSSSSWITQFLPETFGIRKSIEDSPYGWCYRESFLWGIATGTVMGIHRLRMKSHPLFAINIAFLTTVTVTIPSYYFCYKKRDHQERVIAMMMAANDFRPGEEIPEQIPVGKDHPFLDVKQNNNNGDKDEAKLQKEFVARLKEKKEWQEPHQIQDANKIFKEKK